MIIWIENARIVSIFAVVLLHVSAIILSENSIGTEYWWVGNIFSTLSRWCVPVFVMLSGALLLDIKKQENLSRFYSKRLSRILVPILFWSIFFSFWNFLTGYIGGDAPTYLELLDNLLQGTPSRHLWFLYMILGLYLVTPFLRKIIKYTNKEEVNILIIFTFIIASINSIYMGFHGDGNPFLFINWFLLYIPFFLIGYFIRMDSNKKRTLLWTIFVLSSLLTLSGYYIVLVEGNLTEDAYFHSYLSMTVIPMSISTMYLLKSWNTPIFSQPFNKKISSLSFGIYLIHPVVLEILNKTGYIKTVHPAISIPSSTVLIFFLSFIVAFVIYEVPHIRRVI